MRYRASVNSTMSPTLRVGNIVRQKKYQSYENNLQSPELASADQHSEPYSKWPEAIWSIRLLHSWPYYGIIATHIWRTGYASNHTHQRLEEYG